jgi:hypothetical protein
VHILGGTCSPSQGKNSQGCGGTSTVPTVNAASEMYISDVETDRSRYSSDRDNLLSYKYLKEGFNAPEKM